MWQQQMENLLGQILDDVHVLQSKIHEKGAHSGSKISHVNDVVERLQRWERNRRKLGFDTEPLGEAASLLKDYRLLLKSNGE